MPLPAPAPRTHLHTRKVVYTGFHREDGLWDIEAQMEDTKTYPMDNEERGSLAPGTPLHGMSIRLTVDDDLVIQSIASSTDHAPFGDCQQGQAPMQKMVGVTLGRGWRKAIDHALGGTSGCTHLRELLFNMATVAFQTIPHYRITMRRLAGDSSGSRASLKHPPYFMNQCIAWRFDGGVVAKHYPQFVGWQPLIRAAKPDSESKPA
jgi:hypothetical protein